MLGCVMNKEKNFPNLFPFLFLAENKWSPESSYHDDIGIRQKNGWILHVLKIAILASLKLGHWHDVPCAPLELPVQRSLWVLEGQLVTKKSEHNVRSSTSPNPIVQSDPHDIEDFFSQLKMTRIERAPTWIHHKLVPDWKSLPLFMEVSHTALQSDEQIGISSCFICYCEIG